jgi:peptide/nickel transport system permease protein
MGRYLLRRLAMSVVVIVLLGVFLALLAHLVPGDPVRLILGPQSSPELAQRVRVEMGLDHSIPRQVWDFVTGALHGDFGRDFVTDLPVARLVMNALPDTLILALAGLGLALLVGVPLGVLSAERAGGWFDHVTAVVSVSLITLPPYVAGLLLLLVFAVAAPVLPATGAGSPSDPLGYLEHLVLPAVALALTWVGYFARLVRSSMLEVLGTDYVRTARALGLGRRLILFKYALRNALVPTVAALGVGLGHLLGGAVFIEVIFSRPGLGTLILDAITTRNYPVVRAAVFVIAALFILANLLADLSYRLLDPRLRVEEAG